MSLIRVTSDELRTQGQQTSQAATNVSETLNTLANQIRDLSTRWEGGASTGFQSLYDEWQQGAQKVQSALEGIATFLGSAADTYEQAEQQIRQSTGH